MERRPGEAAAYAHPGRERQGPVAGSHRRVRLDIFGDSVELPGALPLGAVCEQLADALAIRRPHFWFDDTAAAATFARLPAAAGCRASVLADGARAREHVDDDDGVLVIVRPCNRQPAGREEKLEAVQQLVCGAGHRPVILANPELEALLLTRRVGKPAPPMFLSDFEQAFFLVEVLAKTGDISAVRRLWRGGWETYRVKEVLADTRASAVADDEAIEDEATDADADVRSGAPRETQRSAALQVSCLADVGDVRPRAAEALVRHLRIMRRGQGDRPTMRRGQSKGETPSKVHEREPWSAEDGWTADEGGTPGFGP